MLLAGVSEEVLITKDDRKVFWFLFQMNCKSPLST